MKDAYAELHVLSAFSFLEGASLPEDLAHRAAELDIGAMAITDRNGVYAAPRFLRAAREAGIRPLVGAEVSLGDLPILSQDLPRSPAPHLPISLSPPFPRLTFLAANRTGYRNLCRLLTRAAHGRPKGAAHASWQQVAVHADGLICLTGGSEGPLARTLYHDGIEATRRMLERLTALFRGRLYVEIQRHHLRDEEHRNRALIELAKRLRLPIVATNGVHYAVAKDRELADILTCTRHGVTLDAAGRLLEQTRERHLKSGREMARLFADLPHAVHNAASLAHRIGFTLRDLDYHFPDFPVPPGETQISFLRAITWREAPTRFRPLTARARAQLARELDLIEKLDLAGYFLIVWDIVAFCRREGILAQGRGSAANSAVCYALSITAVDPVKMDLLFERFLSEERGEWPDIDLDLPSGTQRERVIQYVYLRYGPHGAALTANVITYRGRSAARDVAKALGLSPDQAGRIARRFGRHSAFEFRDGTREMNNELRAAGLDPASPLAQHFARLWWKIQHLPRHLGQHPGGMVLAAGRLDDIVPLEGAAMRGRTIIQWDKDDIADLGLIKVDLLGLGMLAVLEEALPLIRTHERVDIDLAHLPPDDPSTYEMIRAADTVGVFQIESRAQMASLPRNAPRHFYDLVVQVALIRPGPITGHMTNPYLERRQGRQAVCYPHPSLKPVLERTLGVPLFQEQLLRIAMTAAGFSGGEAEELRRAMGFKRSNERMQAIESKLRLGMQRRGIVGKAQDEIVHAITSFALYGFPESHAASFALIVYASAYLKRHHPAAYTTALLNAWPMGFYHPATIVKDAQRHGIEVRPADVQRSGWHCRLEEGAVRLGLRYVKGLGKAAGKSIERAREDGPFTGVSNLARRCHLSSDELDLLAHVGALASLDTGGSRLTRRQALWQAADVASHPGPLFEHLPAGNGSPLPEMNAFEETVADYAELHLTTGPHLLSHARTTLNAAGVTPIAGLMHLPEGRWVRAAGIVIVRQRPSTANGVVFITMEDETGMIQAIIRPGLFSRQRSLIVTHPALIVEGYLQKRDQALSIRAQNFEALSVPISTSCHDFF